MSSVTGSTCSREGRTFNTPLAGPLSCWLWLSIPSDTQGQWAAIEKFAASCSGGHTDGKTEPQPANTAPLPVADDRAPGEDDRNTSTADASADASASASGPPGMLLSADEAVNAAPAALELLADEPQARQPASERFEPAPARDADEPDTEREAPSTASWPGRSQTDSASTGSVRQGAAASEHIPKQPATSAPWHDNDGEAARLQEEVAQLDASAPDLHYGCDPANVTLPAQLLQSVPQPGEAVKAVDTATDPSAGASDPLSAAHGLQHEHSAVAAREPEAAEGMDGAHVRRGAVAAAVPVDMCASWPAGQRHTQDGEVDDTGSSWESDMHAGADLCAFDSVQCESPTSHVPGTQPKLTTKQILLCVAGTPALGS